MYGGGDRPRLLRPLTECHSARLFGSSQLSISQAAIILNLASFVMQRMPWLDSRVHDALTGSRINYPADYPAGCGLLGIGRPGKHCKPENKNYG